MRYLFSKWYKNVISDIKQRIELETALKILAIDSSYDQITQASYVYRNRHVYPYLESKGFEVVRCQGRFARRVYVQPEASREDIVYMTGVGHGVYTTYMGEYCNFIFDMKNKKLTFARI